MKRLLRILVLLSMLTPLLARTQCAVLELGNNISICQGDQVTLNALNSGATYIWSNGSTSSSIDVTTSGTYHVAVTLNSCTVRDTVSVTVVPVLWNDFAFTQVADCSPVTYQFSDRSRTCGGTITGWLWEFGDGTTSTQQNPAHNYFASGQYNVRLTITDNHGNTSRRTRRVTVTITAVNIRLGSDTTICQGNSIILDAFLPSSTYLWNTGDTSSSIIANAAGDYSVAVTKNGCTSKDTIHINTASSVTARATHTAGGVCLPVRVRFTDGSEAHCGQTLTAWFWDFGDGTSSTEQHPEHDYYSADSFTVRLTTTVSNGAQSTVEMKIEISNSDYELNLGERMIVCLKDSFQLDSGVAADEYQWSPASYMNDAHIAMPTVKPAHSGWLKVHTKKCLIEKTDSVYVFVDSVAKPSFRQEGNFLRAPDARSYEWYFAGERIPNVTGNTVRVDRSGFYSVKVFNENGCSAFSDATFVMPAPRGDAAGAPIVMRCTPNPTRGPFNVILSRLPETPLKFTLYDRYGRVMLVRYLEQHVTGVHVPNMSPGMYYVEATINNKKTVVPVVVQ
jgi:PKD repeat protein